MYSECWLYRFVSVLGFFGSTPLTSYEQQDKFYFYKKIEKSFPANFFYIGFYLKAFDSFIPKLVVSKYCYRTKSVHVLYYILKKYQNSFDFSLNNLDKEYNDYYFTTHLKNELQNELTKNFNKFSFLKNLLKFSKNNTIW